ncbi:MAG: trigger factor [Bacteroidota bacterium]
MQTTLNPLTPVDYELQIEATAADLADEIKQALKTQRQRTQLKGFRPGKVPANIVKKLYGKDISFAIAAQRVQDTYEAEVLKNDDYDVLGQPTITTLDYNYDTDGSLSAVVEFGVRTPVELADLSAETVSKLVHHVTDEDVDGEIERLRLKQADLVPVEDEPVQEEDFVIIEMEMLDDDGEPIADSKEEDLQFFLNDPRVKKDLAAALVGKEASEEAFEIELEHEGEQHDDEHEHPEAAEGDAEEDTPTHTHTYRVTLKEAKRRDLPDLDDDFVEEVTEGEITDMDAFRTDIRERLEEQWEARSRETLENKLQERMLALHSDLPVANSVVDFILDNFLDDLKRRYEDNLPETFDEAAFRDANRDDALTQGRWMMIRDAIVAQQEIEVTDDDYIDYMNETFGGNDKLSPELMLTFYRQQGMLEQLEMQIQTRRAYDWLIEQVTIVEKDRETLEREAEERRAAADAEQEAAAEAAEADAEAEAATEDAADSNDADAEQA